MRDLHSAEVAIVGGGPAGAALAIRLARAGRDIVLFERRTAPAWRACGVYSSPLSRGYLAQLGLSRRDLDELIRPISALDLASTRGGRCRLEYAAPFACGIDRVRLDQLILELARRSGARVKVGSVVTRVDLPDRSGRPGRLHVADTVNSGPGAAATHWDTRLVVGADGPRSIVARAAGVDRPIRHLRRAGITYHHADPVASPDGEAMDGRFVFGDGWYVGVAPVPGRRVNIGIVVTESLLRTGLRATKPGTGIDALARNLLAQFPRPHEAWQSGARTDTPSVAFPLAHRVTRRAGAGFLLCGDAAGFIDPLSGEGLHRALASSAVAARTVTRMLDGDASAPSDYDRHLRARFRNKDLVSWLLQIFLARPALLDYGLRRLGARDADRATFARAMADQLPASRVIDPRFLVRVLRP